MSSPTPAMPPAGPQDASRYAWIDQVRGWTALYVVLHHAMLNVARVGAAPGRFAHYLRFFLGAGHYAVDVFIVLSGFCLMLPLVGAARFGDMRAFIVRRTVRIVLPYYGAMAVSLLLIALWVGAPSDTHWAVSLPVTGWGVLTHLLLLHQWWQATAAQINHAFWSIGVEYQIYFLFPVFFWAGIRYGFRIATAAAIVLGYALWFATRKVGWPDPDPWGASLYYLGLFCMGALAAKEVWRHATAQDAGRWLDRALPWLILAGCLFAVATEYYDRVALQERSLVIGATAALYLYARAIRGERRPAARKVWTGLVGGISGWLGTMGFSLYLIHAPVLELVWRYVVEPWALPGAPAQIGAMLVLGGTASVATSFVFYRCVEAPCHAASRRIAARWRTRRAVARPADLSP